jgi:hypothetical protein
VVSAQFAVQIQSFVAEINEPYVCVEDVSDDGIRAIYDQSLRFAVSRDEQTKARVLELLQRSWRENKDHARRRDWGRLAVGICTYLLLPSRVDESAAAEGADVLVRLARWNYSTSQNIYARFIPFAREVVDELFGDIGNLYQAYSRRAA